MPANSIHFSRRAPVRVAILLVLTATISLGYVTNSVPIAAPRQASRPEVIRAVAPGYPALVNPGDIQPREVVVVGARINESGEVTSVNVVGGRPVFRLASVTSAKLWRFEPSDSSTTPRTVNLVFVYRIMTPETPSEELGTVFKPPYEVEVRSPYFKLRGNKEK